MPITKTINLLPAIFQSDANQKFLNATLDQLVTEPNLKPVSGYVGRKFAPGFTDISTYIRETTQDRADYQLEPSIVSKNQTTGEVEFLSTYPEYLQKIRYYGGNTTNPNKLFNSDFYSYDPNINLDAFINFGEYYWLPNGPDAVSVTAGTVAQEKTFYPTPEPIGGVYYMNGFGTIDNPDITLARGGVYTFAVNQASQPFWIQTDPGLSGVQLNNNNLSSRAVLGVDNNGEDVGTVTFTVPTKTAQDFFVNMNVVQNVDLVTTQSYAQLQGTLLSTINSDYNGIDGQHNNLNGKFLIFGHPYFDDANWTSGSTTITGAQRNGIWQINLVSNGSGDFYFNLSYYANIPVNNKVIIQSGIAYGNTQWYVTADNILVQLPVITANLDTLYYQNGSVATEVGIIKLVEASGNYIDVTTEILGKANYISPNGVLFTNGLKIKFDSTVIPAEYKDTEYYVDGVGTSIVLVPVSDLIVNFAQSRANYNPALLFQTPSTATLNASKDEITISTTDVPADIGVLYGTFPNNANSNFIVEQDINLSYPYRGGQNTQGDHTSIQLLNSTIAMSVAGIPVYGPSNGWEVPGINGTVWHYNAGQVLVNGEDTYGGTPDSAGRYHYRNSQFITANAWGNLSGFENGSYTTTTGHSKIIGFAADGYPIYGPYGYSNSSDPTSAVIRMSSSYVASSNNPSRPQSKTVSLTANAISTNTITVSSAFGLNPGMRVTTNTGGLAENTYWIINNGLATATGPGKYTGGTNQIQLNTNVTLYANTSITFDFLPGSFIEDYTYTLGTGTLDQYNGRFCVTPEFPNGTYAYFATQNSSGAPTYPYFVGQSYYGKISIDTNTSLTTPDYIIINRASRDLNPWTRRNRWFHKDVIAATANYNLTPILLDQDYRAKRPIIEFDPNLQLFDFGKNGLQPVDLFDNTITQPFVQVEGTTGIYIDGINVVDGMRLIFAADQDPATRGKIWQVTFINIDGLTSTPPTIHLTLASDGNVVEYDTVSVFNGLVNAGKSFWYNGTVWDEGQTKTSQNQPPVFDVFDTDGVSFGDKSKYPISNNSFAFAGTKIFSYTTGTGTADPVLGFPLKYKNFNNIGDIQFSNNFDTDTFLYTIDLVDYTDKINTGFLYKNLADGSVTKLNCWTKVVQPSRQYQDISYIFNGIDNLFTCDVLPDTTTTIPNLLVYVNYNQVPVDKYRIYPSTNNSQDIWIDGSLLKEGDRVDILVYSSSTSKLGFFEIPINLNFNAQNSTVETSTLGELRNHIMDMKRHALNFVGTFPGNSNLRDIDIAAQGGTILQQSAPVSLGEMFLCSDTYNFATSILYAQQEYTRFKNKFLSLAETGQNIANITPVQAVDQILTQMNLIKNSTFPWYYSDMIPYGANRNVIVYNVFDPAQRNYQLTEIFSNSTLSNKAVSVYHNTTQLLYQRDYEFLTTGPGVVFKSNVTLNVDDVITIIEYRNTDGCFVPETPTKLGLYPKFTPEIYTDNTYNPAQTFIKGHDGSLTPSYGDFRDQLLLELEKRIYNNIKVTYSDKLVNIYDSKPGKFRETSYSLTEFNQITSKNFLPWVGFNRLDYLRNDIFNVEDAFTYNYSTAADTVDGELLPGSWRACYDYFYDCQVPHLKPWEMLGFSERPDWWVSTYGPAPYTSGNEILWTDLEAGYIASGDRVGYDSNFARPGLSSIIPVDAQGNLKVPVGLLTTSYNEQFDGNWLVGQIGPVENAWRTSSEYPYAVQLICALSRPADYFSFGIATSKYKYNAELKQYIVTTTNQRLTPADIDVNGTFDSSGNVTRAAGYLNWIADYQTVLGIVDKTPLIDFVNDYSIQLAYRMAGFSSKDKLKILAEQNSPNSVNESIIIPDSDYDLILNKSTPLTKPIYSAVIIEKTAEGFAVSGYDNDNPYFGVIPPVDTGSQKTIKVLDQAVKYFTSYRPFKINVPYGSVFTSYQQLTNFLSGYERWLNVQGFRFDYFDSDLGQIRNWELSTKEFLFWAQQGWPTGSVIVLGPFANRIKFSNPSATIDGITDSFYGSKIATQNFNIVNSDSYTVSRDNNVFRLTLDSNIDLIGLASLNLVQFEHALIFNNTTQFNDIIYNPNLGQRQFRLKLIGFKTEGWTGTLAAQGFMYNPPNVVSWTEDKDYLRGDLVEYKNFYYSAKNDLPGASEFIFKDWLPVARDKIKTGFINNFATNAGQSVDYYDTDVVNLESKFDLYSLGLIGYRNRSYLADLGLSDTSQVKFYQGFIKQKGTRNAIDALGNITLNNQESAVSLTEDWAFRVGEYGSLETNQFVELVLDESYVLNNPTSLEVTANNSVVYGSVYNSNDGLYKTATLPWNAPIFLNRDATSSYIDDIQTAGFVNVEDVDFTVFDIANLDTLTADISSIGTGSVIWVAKDYNQSWNVYRVSDTPGKITRIVNALSNRVAINTNGYHGMSVDDIIMITNVAEFNGFYKVYSVVSPTEFIVNYSGSINLASFTLRTYQDAPIYKLTSQRVTRASDIGSLTPLSGWQVGDKAWVEDDTTSGQWAVYDKSEPWEIESPMPKGVYSNLGKFGTSVKLSYDNNFAAVGEPGASNGVGTVTNYVLSFDNQFIEDITVTSRANNSIGLGTSLASGKDIVVAGAPLSSSGLGYAFVYSRNQFGTITQLQILAPNVANTAAYGTSIAISEDDQWIYIGAPDDNKVYVYGYYEGATTETDTVTGNAVQTSFTLNFTPVSAELISVSGLQQDYVPFVDYTVSGQTLTFTTAPASGSIVIRQVPGYIYVDTISGPNANSKFGYSVSSATNGRQIVVGAPYTTVNSLAKAGSVSTYDRSVEQFVAIADQTLFGGVRTVKLLSKVYVNNVLQTQGSDYVIVASTWVQFTTAPGAGSIVTIETNSFNLIENIYADQPQANSQFGFSTVLCPYNCSVYVGSPYYTSGINYKVGSVYRFLNQGRVYGTITGGTQNPVVTSGNSIRINDFEIQFLQTTLNDVVAAINNSSTPGITAANVNGYLQINSTSTINANKLQILPGVGTAITDLGLDVFAFVEHITNPTDNAYDSFGFAVAIDTTSTILTVGGPNAKTYHRTTFDVYKSMLPNSTQIFGTMYVDNTKSGLRDSMTTFDAGGTKFKDNVPSGAVWVMSYLGDSRNDINHAGNFNFIEQLSPVDLQLPLIPDIGFGYSVDIKNYEMLVGAPTDNQVELNGGAVYKFVDLLNLKGWDSIRTEEPKVDINSIIKNYIYSVADQTIISSLDYIDPAKGKILGLAEQEITYKTDYDPAVYNNAAGAEVSQSNTFFWNDTQVGDVWWDLSTVKYIDYEQGSIKYRTTNWGRVFPGSSIDVYEWVESIYPPSQYVDNGGDGTPKYPNNSAYVTLSYVDPGTNQATVKYYFWVKNKSTATLNQFGRELPTVTIAEYIRDPRNSGVKFMAAIRDDSVSVYNVVTDTTGKDTVLHIDYATKLNNNIIHSEYALLSEAETSSTAIPTNIYNKLVDSVSGNDQAGNPVPDPTLPVQSRYGIDIRPRQSMFVDKNAAVEQMVTYANSVFAKNVISQGFDLTALGEGEPIPPAESGYYDIVVNTYEELTYIDIITKPVGFQVLVLADVNVSNLWTVYTKDRTVLYWAPNTSYTVGQIVSYNNTAYYVVTAFTSGSTFNAANLSIYSGSDNWLLTRVQSYRASDYWEYIDWYAEGIDKTVTPKYTVNTFADMTRIRYKPQDIVKVLNNGQGKWTLVQVFPNVTTTIGLEGGTIALKENLYNLSKFGMAFGADNFDSQRFDQNPSIELRKILNAIKNDIFINQLSQDFINLFFVFVYYVLDEQKYVDWVFKTSFIKVLHKIKGLTQPPLYARENQEYYKQYIEEVKPYHTTIREYIVNYQGVDNWNGYTTDFDVPAFYDPVLQMYRSPSGEFVEDAEALKQAKYQDWLINYPYVVGDIVVVDGGSGYTIAPQITITGSTIGNDAVARALITNGQISKVEILYGGSNYITQPVVTLSGGNGTGARLYAQLANDTVRKIKTTLVYDRITYGSEVQEWAANTAYTQGSIVAYNNVAYVVNNDFTSGTYFVGNDLSTYEAAKFNNANDRIQSYYQPTAGMPGKQFGLLQSGIDYPGVIVEGPLFTDGGGFDVGGFDTSVFDGLSIDEDGTFIISDAILDTKITSSYTDTSIGTRPEDIIVDGGGYVDTYSSHAPEELIPGRVYDTMDMTVYTFSTPCNTAYYTDWYENSAFYIANVAIIDSGLGYDSNISVTISGGGSNVTVISTANATIDANGNVTAINIINPGVRYTEIPNVVITGSNTSPARAAVRLAPYNINEVPVTTFQYRYFKDMNDNVQYLREWDSGTTTLASNLAITDTEIEVVDVSKLPTPNPSSGIPGIVFINGERITYWQKFTSNNTLGQIRRGTAGTGSITYLANSSVVDGSINEEIPYTTHTLWTPNVDVTKTTTALESYTFIAGQTYIQSHLWYGVGSLPIEITEESLGPNVAVNVIITQSNIAITTEGGGGTANLSTPTDGQGLASQNTIQVIFLKEA